MTESTNMLEILLHNVPIHATELDVRNLCHETPSAEVVEVIAHQSFPKVQRVWSLKVSSPEGATAIIAHLNNRRHAGRTLRAGLGSGADFSSRGVVFDRPNVHFSYFVRQEGVLVNEEFIRKIVEPICGTLDDVILQSQAIQKGRLTGTGYLQFDSIDKDKMAVVHLYQVQVAGITFDCQFSDKFQKTAAFTPQLRQLQIDRRAIRDQLLEGRGEPVVARADDFQNDPSNSISHSNSSASDDLGSSMDDHPTTASVIMTRDTRQRRNLGGGASPRDGRMISRSSSASPMSQHSTHVVTPPSHYRPMVHGTAVVAPPQISTRPAATMPGLLSIPHQEAILLPLQFATAPIVSSQFVPGQAIPAAYSPLPVQRQVVSPPPMVLDPRFANTPSPPNIRGTSQVWIGQPPILHPGAISQWGPAGVQISPPLLPTHTQLPPSPRMMMYAAPQQQIVYVTQAFQVPAMYSQGNVQAPSGFPQQVQQTQTQSLYSVNASQPSDINPQTVAQPPNGARHSPTSSQRQPPFFPPPGNL